MQYTDYVAQLAALLVIPVDDDRFVQLLPWIISYAELAIYRDPDFDFLATRGPADSTGRTTVGSRLAPVPTAIIVVEMVNLITPANVAPAKGTRIPLLRTTRAYIDQTWPNEARTMPPQRYTTYYTIQDQQNPDSQFIIAPTPDGIYTVEVYGTHRPAALSALNPSTFLTEFMPDLFVAKSMEIATGGILKNFGAAAENPQMAQSWANVYQGLRRGVAVESMRQKAISSGWSSLPPAPLAPMARASRAGPPPMAAPAAPGGA